MRSSNKFHGGNISDGSNFITFRFNMIHFLPIVSYLVLLPVLPSVIIKVFLLFSVLPVSLLLLTLIYTESTIYLTGSSRRYVLLTVPWYINITTNILLVFSFL